MKSTVTWYTEGITCKCGQNLPIGVVCPSCNVEPEDNEDNYWDGEFSWDFPAKYEVCPDCGGRGTTYLGWSASEQPAFTQEDLDYEGPDFFEDYIRGAYDRQCPNCRGKRVVPVISENEIPKSHLPIWESYMDHVRSEAEFEAICASERRMGA